MSRGYLGRMVNTEHVGGMIILGLWWKGSHVRQAETIGLPIEAPALQLRTKPATCLKSSPEGDAEGGHNNGCARSFAKS